MARPPAWGLLLHLGLVSKYIGHAHHEHHAVLSAGRKAAGRETAIATAVRILLSFVRLIQGIEKPY